MKQLLLAVTLCLIAVRTMASPVSFVPASGPRNLVGYPDQADCWCEPADLNGLIGSSEEILSLGLDSEIANDFVWPPNTPGIAVTIWWGAFFNNDSPCASGIATPGFNLRFYSDAGCKPGAIVAAFSITDFSEESIGCQAGVYPMFKWSTTAVVNLTSGLYWFAAQMKDHAFAPQAGRLASGYVTGCASVFRSAYFGFKDWTPVIDVFGVEVDFSQGFGDVGSNVGACCIGSEEDCVLTTEADCHRMYGRFHGIGTTCEPNNPCQQTAGVGDGPGITKQSTTWGSIKGLYR